MWGIFSQKKFFLNVLILFYNNQFFVITAPCYYCSIDFKRQSGHLGFRPDTGSLVFFCHLPTDKSNPEAKLHFANPIARKHEKSKHNPGRGPRLISRLCRGSQKISGGGQKISRGGPKISRGMIKKLVAAVEKLLAAVEKLVAAVEKLLAAVKKLANNFRPPRLTFLRLHRSRLTFLWSRRTLLFFLRLRRSRTHCLGPQCGNTEFWSR